MKVVEDPSEISFSRLATILLTAAAIPVLTWTANIYWSYLYSISRWGPKQNMSELGFSSSIFIAVMTFFALIFAVSVLPWKMSRMRVLFSFCPAILLMAAFNLLAVRRYWEENITLDPGYLLNLYGLIMAICVPVNYLVAGMIYMRMSRAIAVGVE